MSVPSQKIEKAYKAWKYIVKMKVSRNLPAIREQSQQLNEQLRMHELRNGYTRETARND